MGWFSAKGRNVTAAARGLVIQRVLVDRWSPARAAAAFGLGERQVAQWVAAYRRRGMESLRDRSGSGDWAPRRWVSRLQAMIEQRVAPSVAADQRQPTPFTRLRHSDRSTRR